MKLLVIAALISVAFGYRFKVKKENATCAMLEVDGSFDVEAFKEGKSVGKKSFAFSKAKLSPNSTCESIHLDTTNSTQVWFNFNAEAGGWSIFPVATFNPKTVFGDQLPSGKLIYSGDEFKRSFEKNQSFSCQSSVTVPLKPRDAGNFTYTGVVKTKNMQIQSSDIVDDKFSDDTVQCSADTPTTTPAPTTVAPPSPASVHHYNCSDGNVTTLRVEGVFSLAVTYLGKDDQDKEVNMTAYIPVPDSSKVVASVCDSNATTESLTVQIFPGWTMTFEFKKSKSDVSVADVKIEYTYDSHLPKAVKTGKDTATIKGSSMDLKAPEKGYYTCKANSTYTSDEKTVTLYSEQFQFRAFDSKGDGYKGDVTQCSADQESNSVVPIAVGAALAALVVIVLIAYLIGRKRSRKSGYESV